MISLSELCIEIVDSEHKTAPQSGNGMGYPLIRTTNVGRGRLNLTDVHRVERTVYDEWTRRAVPQPGDLILSREAPVGNVALITSGMEPVLGQRTVLLRPDGEKVDAAYLTYRLLAHDTQHWMSGVANGATVPHLNMEDIRRLPLPALPPFRLQVQIGAVLATFDDAIANNLRRIRILEELARLLYRDWFVRYRYPGNEEVDLVDTDLGLIPEGWDISRLGDVLELVYGKALKAEDRTGGTVAVYGSGGHIGWHNERLVNGPGIVVGRKGNVGSVYWSSGDFYPIDTTYYVKSDLPLRFLDQFLRTLKFVDSHVAVPGLSRDSAYRLVFAKPEDELLSRFDAVVRPLYDLVRSLSRQSVVLREARDLLLPRLVSGELDESVLHLGVEVSGV